MCLLVFSVSTVSTRRVWKKDENLRKTVSIGWDFNCDFNNKYDIGSRMINIPQDCVDFCMENLTCTHFSYDVNTKFCVLKTIESYSFLPDFSMDRVCGFLIGRTLKSL